jgi:hypothetical protein
MRVRDVGRWWGTTADERAEPFPCDRTLADHDAAYFRGVTVAAQSDVVFRWLCQLRVAPYSYDWIDNRGRRSPRELTPGLTELTPGQRVMSIFELVAFERDVHITLRLRRPGLFPPMAVSYLLRPRAEGGCRLLVKLVVAHRDDLRDRLLGPVFPWLDWLMMRRQLLNLKALSEGAV